MATIFGFGLLKGLIIIWAVVTGVTFVLLIYRSILGAHEDDQLFLGEGDRILKREQQDVQKKERTLAPLLYALGAASVVLLLFIVGVWLYRGLLMT